MKGDRMGKEYSLLFGCLKLFSRERKCQGNHSTSAHKKMDCGKCIHVKLNMVFYLFLQYSAKLLKKPDQCRAVYACSHLFWVDDQDGIKDGERYTLLV